MILTFIIFIYLFLVMSYVYSRKNQLKMIPESYESQVTSYNRRARLFSDEPNPNFSTD